MARDLSGRIIIAGVLAAAVALGVTATVTAAMSQPVGAYAPVITNLKNGNKFIWQRHPFADKAKCDAALGNLPEFLAAVRDPDPNAKVPDAEGDAVLVDDVQGAVLQIWMNTGVLPSLGISCELQGSPA